MDLETLRQHRQSLFFALTVFTALLMIGMFFVPVGFPGLVIGGMLSISLLGFRDVAWHATKPDHRQEQLGQLGPTINFSYTEQTEHNPLGLSDSFLLTKRGVEMAKAIEGTMILNWFAFALPKFRNFFQRTIDDMTVAVFDYECSENDESPVVKQTVFALQSPDLHCPHVALCPATTWDRFASKVSSSVQLACGYRVTSEDEELAAELAEQLGDLLDGATWIEFGEGHLLLYRRDQLVEHYQIDTFIKEGMTAYPQIADFIASRHRACAMV